jgi:hypothetical protein
MDITKYSDYGQMMTGFSSGNEESFYGHWTNPEYQEQEMFANMSEEEYQDYLKKQSEEKQETKLDSENFDDSLPF